LGHADIDRLAMRLLTGKLESFKEGPPTKCGGNYSVQATAFEFKEGSPTKSGGNYSVLWECTHSKRGSPTECDGNYAVLHESKSETFAACTTTAKLSAESGSEDL